MHFPRHLFSKNPSYFLMISDISTHSWRVFVYTLYNFTYTIHFQHTLDIFSVLSECISSYFDICYRIATYSFLCLLHSVAMDPGPGSKLASGARPGPSLPPLWGQGLGPANVENKISTRKWCAGRKFQKMDKQNHAHSQQRYRKTQTAKHTII